MSSLLEMEPYVDSAIEEMSTRLGGFANSPTEVNMAFWMQAYAFDVVGELAFGRAFGYLASGQDIGGQMANLRGWLKKRFAVGMIPWFFPIFMSPVAAFFSSASKEEQEDQKKRLAVIIELLAVADNSSRQMRSKVEWDDPKIVVTCCPGSLKRDILTAVR
jgi:hypothetical protein